MQLLQKAKITVIYSHDIMLDDKHNIYSVSHDFLYILFLTFEWMNKELRSEIIQRARLGSNHIVVIEFNRKHGANLWCNIYIYIYIYIYIRDAFNKFTDFFV